MFSFSSSQAYTTSGAMQLCVVHVLSTNPSIHQSIIYQLGGGGGDRLLGTFCQSQFHKTGCQVYEEGDRLLGTFCQSQFHKTGCQVYEDDELLRQYIPVCVSLRLIKITVHVA